MRRSLRQLIAFFVALGFLTCGTLHGWAMAPQAHDHSGGAHAAHGSAAGHASHSDRTPDAPAHVDHCAVMQCLSLLCPTASAGAQAILLSRSALPAVHDTLSGRQPKPDLPPPRLSV